ncbi:hypothetical protein [Proteiniborus sp.]|uniref:hypothetical protein n=1 Tax=Proteiniborus sp. TaxID=2079015 RepID=UPI0033245A29
MRKKDIKVLDFVVLILIVFLLGSGILNSIAYYQHISHESSALKMSFIFILGALTGLVIKSGLIFVFWNSYEIKYGKDNRKYKTLRKVIASFLFLSIASALFGNEDLVGIFIACTLVFPRLFSTY